MSALRECQAVMAATLEQGPDALPATLFSGATDRILLGLKAHANSISHARLVAMEDSFPRYRAAAGHAVFNTLSRAYVDSGMGCDRPIAAIGDMFPTWLQCHGASHFSALPPPVLAQFDWQWLVTLYAADAPALAAAALAEHGDAVLALPLIRHPAAAMVPNTVGLAMALNMPDWTDAPAILLSRPHFEVRATALTAPMLALWDATVRGPDLGTALAQTSDHFSEGTLVAAVLALIGVGAFSVEGSTA